jgi:hypothetical protein
MVGFPQGFFKSSFFILTDNCFAEIFYRIVLSKFAIQNLLFQTCKTASILHNSFTFALPII